MAGLATAPIVLVAACSGGDGGSGTGPPTPPPAVATPVVAIVGGDAQRALVTLPLSQPVAARVTVNGVPAGGAVVSFTVARGAGQVDPPSSTTDAQGEARTTWTMGPAAGEGELTVTATLGGRASTPVSARATADPAQGVLLSVIDGMLQEAVVATAVPVPPTVLVRDSAGAPLAGVRVAFTVTEGNGVVTGGSVRSDAAGIARVARWQLGGATGMNALRVAVEGAWVAAPVTITATAVAPGETTLFPPRQYHIVAAAGDGIVDSVTGARFVFPAGARGTLSVARIADGRPLPYGTGTAARVTWSGAEPLQLAMPRDGSSPNALLWGVPRHSMEGGKAAQWMALPRLRSTTDSVTFALSEGDALLEPAGALAWRFPQAAPAPASGTRTIAVVRLPSAQAQQARLAALEQEVRSGLAAWRQAISARWWTQWDALVQAHPIHFAHAFPDPATGTCPAASRYVTRVRDGVPTIEFCSTANLGRGHHELGHHVSDLLPRLRALDPNPLLDRAPGELNATRGHEWGDSWWPSRYTITEDYAFFSEHLLAGRAGGYIVDGTAPDFFINGLSAPPC